MRFHCAEGLSIDTEVKRQAAVQNAASAIISAMTNLKISRALAIIVALTGVVVIFGWLMNIPVLTSVLPHWVTMKFSTALCFFFSGVTLFLITNAVVGRQEISRVTIPIGVGGILLLMASLLASTLLGVRIGIEDLFVEEKEGAIMTTTPGRPSVGTMIDFILVAIAGILTMLNPEKFRPVIQKLGWIVGPIGAVALVGYVLDMPGLYYHWEGFSTAMAIHTAILFVMLGAGLVLLGAGKQTATE